MWLITPIGFFSIVQKPRDKADGTLTVRSRIRSDLALLKQQYLPGLGPILESHDTDYRFRAVAHRAEVSAAMARMVDSLDYSNFKSEVGKRQGQKRAGLYHKVWDVLHHLQTDPAFVEKEPVAESYGGVVVSGGRKVLLREPTQHQGGYAWTFAKTEAKPDESPQATAVRAVREKTGYDAKILIRIPGAFKGSASSTRYYLMEARHPPGNPNWQTAGLRWERFDEARHLIRQSPNAEGRDRDLAILDAVEKVESLIPYKEHPNVQPEDWQELKAMPEQQTVLYPKLWFNPDEMAKIRRGFFPTVMEHKWFLYFTSDRLRVHRSWTGFLIFDVGFAFDPKGGAYVTDVIVNREIREYSNKDDAEDLKLLEEIIRDWLLQPLEEPVVDGFIQGVMLASKPNYLGSPEVVHGLVGEIFDVAVRAIKDEATAVEMQTTAAKVGAAFTDDSAGYTRMPGWHSAEQMGTYVKKYLVGVEGVHDGDTLQTILSNGLAAVFSKLNEMLAAFLADDSATWQDHALVQLNELHQYVVAVLLGTNTLSYGDRTIKEFHWTPLSQVGAGGKQVIVEVGAEGGSLTLLGSQSPGGWKFRLETSEAALADDETTNLPDRPWVATWRSALKQLDQYPWLQLHPLDVHADFRDRVLKALKTRAKKGSAVDWIQWHFVLGPVLGETAEIEPLSVRLVDEKQSSSLRDLSFVMGIVQDQLEKSISRRQDYLQGQTSAADAMKSDIAEVRALADLFNGGSKSSAMDYQITAWNSPSEMGSYLKKLHKLECDGDEAAFTVLMNALNEAYAEMDFVAEMNESVTGDDQRWRIEGIAEFYAYSLIGMPYPTDDE